MLEPPLTCLTLYIQSTVDPFGSTLQYVSEIQPLLYLHQCHLLEVITPLFLTSSSQGPSNKSASLPSSPKSLVSQHSSQKDPIKP